MGWAGSARGSPAGSLPGCPRGAASSPRCGPSAQPQLQGQQLLAGTAQPCSRHPGQGREDEKMEGKHGAEGVESKPEEGIWLEKEQHKGYKASVSRGVAHRTGRSHQLQDRGASAQPAPTPVLHVKKVFDGLKQWLFMRYFWRSEGIEDLIPVAHLPHSLSSQGLQVPSRDTEPR